VLQRHFLTAPSLCRGLNCPPLGWLEQRLGQIVCGSDCHSQCLDPLLIGRSERLGGGRTVRPLWGRMVTICRCLLGELLQCRMVRVGVSQCLNGGWSNHQGTVCVLPSMQGPMHAGSGEKVGTLKTCYFCNNTTKQFRDVVGKEYNVNL
jgi:hypothetical protein